MKLKRYPLRKRSDERGWLIQNDYPELADKIKHFILSFTRVGGIRGNHYHKLKREWFCIVKGEAELSLFNIQTKEKYETKLSGKNPELVEMEPNVVHTLRNIGTEDLMFFEIIDVPFDEKNPDTYVYKLV